MGMFCQKKYCIHRPHPGFDGLALNPGHGWFRANWLVHLRRPGNSGLQDHHSRSAGPEKCKDSYADISLAKQVLGYTPGVSREDGLREIVDSKK
jgi:hypothetical protein